MINKESLKDDVMDRVRVVHCMQRATRPLVEIAFLAVITMVASASVYWGAAFRNMLAGGPVYTWPVYIFSSFIQTEFAVQFVLLAGLVGLILFAYDAATLLRRFVTERPRYLL